MIWLVLCVIIAVIVFLCKSMGEDWSSGLLSVFIVCCIFFACNTAAGMVLNYTSLGASYIVSDLQELPDLKHENIPKDATLKMIEGETAYIERRKYDLKAMRFWYLPIFPMEEEGIVYLPEGYVLSTNRKAIEKLKETHPEARTGCTGKMKGKNYDILDCIFNNYLYFRNYFYV